MSATFAKGVVLGAVTAVVTLGTTAAVAGGDVARVFGLDKVNHVTRSSGLSGKTHSPLLTVSQKGKAAGVKITVPKGQPPLAVNSSSMVKHLDAQLLDGKHASDFAASCPLHTGGLIGDASVNNAGGYPTGQLVPFQGAGDGSAWNCTGKKVLIDHLSAGTFLVVFVGTGVASSTCSTKSFGTAVVCEDAYNYSAPTPGLTKDTVAFQVITSVGGSASDTDFTIAAYGYGHN